MSKTDDADFKLGPMNHVGVAVPDIEAAIAFYRDVMGVSDITEPTILAPQGVKYAFVNLNRALARMVRLLFSYIQVMRAAFSLN